MSIIFSSNGKNAIKLDKSSFDKEDYLQKYIHENPDSIPLYEIKEDIRLLILSREFSTNSGPIDALGIDKYGELYIVETKLYKNADKRTVVAQALDYGAALWKHADDFNEFVATLNKHTQKTFHLTLNEKIQEFFGLDDEDVSIVMERVKNNLNDGIFHFVILMDKLDDRLKDLILFVNQNSQFDIYAVLFEYYKHESYEIIIPKIFGTEVKKDIAVASASSNSSREVWNEEKLLQQARETLSADVYENFKKLYDFSKTNADEVRFGTGQKGSFNPIWNRFRNKSLFSLYTNGRLGINFHWLLEDDQSNFEIIKDFKDKLESIGFNIPEDYLKVRPGYDPDVWSEKTSQFIEVIQSF
jgi:hypothetical protein